MFAEYQAGVLRSYHQKKAANQLRTTLIRPTPANLRDECEAVVEKRFQKNDVYALRSFFGEHADQTAYSEAICKFDIDLFKPLVNLLKGNIKNTDRKNIELLAWLIDFEPRPYRIEDPFAVSARKEPGGHEERIDRAGDVVIRDGQVANAQPVLWGKLLSIPKKRRTTLLIVLLALAGTGAYLFWGHGGAEGCMIWTGDQYKQVSCNHKQGDAMVLALDTSRLVHFKKITRQDTITARALGRVWYSKINNEVEFFTADGYHPVHVERHLKPLTLYMINKYISHK